MCESIDFHTFRHTCGGWLVMAGVPLNVVQQVMYHSTITLTIDTYGHWKPVAEAEAVESLKEVLAPVDALAPTGTDEARSSWRSSRRAKRCVEGATRCEETDSSPTDPIDENGCISRAGSGPVRHSTMRGLPWAPLAQLAEQLTLNQ